MTELFEKSLPKRIDLKLEDMKIMLAVLFCLLLKIENFREFLIIHKYKIILKECGTVSETNLKKTNLFKTNLKSVSISYCVVYNQKETI